MSAAWPTAAAACVSGIDRRRSARPSLATPVAMAPELTSTTWRPGRTAAISSARAAMRVGEAPVPRSVTSPLPTFTTSRRTRPRRRSRVFRLAPGPRGRACREPRGERAYELGEPAAGDRRDRAELEPLRRAVALQPLENRRPGAPRTVGLDQVDLVGDDDLRTLGERRRVGTELPVDRVQVLHRIPSGQWIEVEEVDQEPTRSTWS